MPKFKAHPSALSEIMASPEKNAMPAGAKTYIQDWAKALKFNRKAQFQSRYTDKGNNLETAGLTLLSSLRGDMFIKNERTFETHFMVGTPDHISPLFDLKLPFSWATFPIFDQEPRKEYFWQLQGYMYLTGAETSELIYILLDATEECIKSEAYARCRARKIDFSAAVLDEVRAELTYPELAPADRVKSFVVERDNDKIEQAIARVELCNKYLAEIAPEVLEMP